MDRTKKGFDTTVKPNGDWLTAESRSRLIMG